MRLDLLPGALAVLQLPPDAVWTDRPDAGPLVSVTRTETELSVVCAESAVPDGARAERGWRALRVAGRLDFALTGILAHLTAPLATAGVPVFVVSTFDTDYVLVRSAHLGAATDALRAAGHDVGGV